MNWDSVVLALEPEGAAFRCRSDLQHVHEELDKPDTLRYVIADCGGGTIDVTVHEITMATKKITELHRASGGDWGGTSVDKPIQDLLSRAIGEECAKDLKKSEKSEWTHFCRETIEKAKRNVKPGSSDRVMFQLQMGLIGAIARAGGDLTRQHVEGVHYTPKKWWQLAVEPHLIQKCFENSLQETARHISEVLSSVEGVNCILVVGGYAESEMLFDHLKTEFEAKCKVIRPASPNLAVVAGAVMFGQNPTIVQARISKFSYGVRYSRI